ncbi:MAG: crossover junction endodeoxyribonuclease RuvC [Christensenellales bacterium]|jgi:crossover junction endodeoxyribonuclease RuvC
MRILGIDPGYALVGFGIIDYNNGETKVVDFGVIETTKDLPMPQRLMMIEQGLEEIFKTYSPEVVAIEELFYFKNQKTIIPVAQARGVIINYCFKTCHNLFEYTPLQIKQALTGYGRAEKQQVQYMTKTILGLEKVPKPDDAADALAVAICHSQINFAINDNQI